MYHQFSLINLQIFFKTKKKLTKLYQTQPIDNEFFCMGSRPIYAYMHLGENVGVLSLLKLAN